LLAGMESAVRNDLKDVDRANYLWSNGEIDRHIQHAVNDYQRVLPQLATLDITVVSQGTGAGVTTSWGGAIAAGGVAQSLMPANGVRNYLLIQNLDPTRSLWIRFGSVATQASPSTELTAGAVLTQESFVDVESISIIGSLTGQAFSALEGSLAVWPTTLRQILILPTGYLWADRVEYPVDQEPPSYRIFREEIPGGGSLFFPIGDPPLVGDRMRVTYAKTHTLSTVVSTIPTEHEELIALGAVAYAARSGTRYAIGRLNASIWTPKGLAAFATESMKAFQAWLEELRDSYSASGAPMPSWGTYPSDWSRV
jgi:hypothetical protein